MRKFNNTYKEERVEGTCIDQPLSSFNGVIMFWDDDGFGDMWDLGDYVVEDVITMPIRRFLHRELEKQGIDPNYWRRKGASITASMVGGFLGSILGGPCGILLGLMGYVAGMTASYPDEPSRAVRELEEALVLTAAGIATKALEEHVTRDTWNEICDEVEYTIQKYKSQNPSTNRAISLIRDAIARVDGNAANQWLTVYKTAAREAGL